MGNLSAFDQRALQEMVAMHGADVVLGAMAELFAAASSAPNPHEGSATFARGLDVMRQIAKALVDAKSSIENIK